MNKKRLLKLADLLETVPRKAFNLEKWQTKAPAKPEGKRQGSCGFAGCAVGWAAHAKLFRGLTIGNGVHHLLYKTSAGDWREWAAVDALFGFENQTNIFRVGDAAKLFAMSAYPRNPTPRQVAKRIRQFIERGGSPSGV